MRSLRPGGNLATPLVEIGERWLGANVAPERAGAFAAALSEIVSAQARCFPGNLFWDSDYAAARLFEAAMTEPADDLTGI
ncbi:MAG TPA: hypothetical protein VLA79_00620, partial [Polyangia bacterium]|nr:hypothetical protein [Polyangia bacterium]